MYYILYIMNSI